MPPGEDASPTIGRARHAESNLMRRRRRRKPTSLSSSSSPRIAGSTDRSARSALLKTEATTTPSDKAPGPPPTRRGPRPHPSTPFLSRIAVPRNGDKHARTTSTQKRGAHTNKKSLCRAGRRRKRSAEVSEGTARRPTRAPATCSTHKAKVRAMLPVTRRNGQIAAKGYRREALTPCAH